MALLDERGLDELTTRRIAERLDVRVGTLYWHVKDKRALLTALADRILAEALPDGTPPERPWREHLRDGAHRLRAALLRHRDGARVVAGYAPVSPFMLRMAESGLRLMREQGVPLATAAYAGDTLMSYVTGYVLQEQAEPTGPPDGSALAGLPLLAEWATTRPAGGDAAFAAGVNFILDGVRTHLAAPSA